MVAISATLRSGLHALHVIALLCVAALAVAATAYTLACAFGLAPWLTFTATFGDVTVANAGQITQIALTFMIALLGLFVPTVGRMNALENSHRKFQIKMEDVARAYHYAHTADRAGVFTLSSEFDAVRERLAYLRDHPDLEKIEPDVLEVAAQMSEKARELADVYSDEKVARAKAFLQQRQEEVEKQQERIVEALHACQQIRKWAQQVDVEESIVASQLAQLDEKLQAALPELGYAIETGDPAEDNIVPLPQKPAAE